MVMSCAGTGTGGPSTSDTVAGTGDLDRSISRAVNSYRARKSMQPLQWNQELAKAALDHSQAMATGKIGIGHSGFNKRFDAFRKSIPGLNKMGENVATSFAGPPDAQIALEAVSRWSNSSQHNKNMLGEFNTTGVGAVRTPSGDIYITQIFAWVKP